MLIISKSGTHLDSIIKIYIAQLTLQIIIATQHQAS